MDNLAPDEKATLVMIYTMNTLVRGEVVIKERMRVNIWPRTQGVPNMLHIFNPNVLLFGGGSPKSFSHTEMYIPTVTMIGFHPALNTDEPLDYEENEVNRSMQPISLFLGTFLVKGQIRIASSASLASSLEVLRSGWLSIYSAEVNNPFVPQMPVVPVKMLLVNPLQVNFIL